MNQEVNLVYCIRLIRKYWRSIVIISVVSLLSSAIMTFMVITPKYQSTVQILVNRSNTNAATEYAGQQADLSMVTTYKELVSNQIILSPTHEMLNEAYDISRSVNQLKDAVSVTSTQNSQVFSVTVKDKSAKASAIIANQIAASFKKQINKIIKINNVTIVSPAEVPTHSISPNNMLNLLVGLTVGLFLSIVYVSLRVLTDRRVQDIEFLTNELALTSLGIINHQHHRSLKVQADNIRNYAENNDALGPQLVSQRVPREGE